MPLILVTSCTPQAVHTRDAGQASLYPGVTAPGAHLPTRLPLRRLVRRRSWSPPDSVSQETGRVPAGCLGNQLLGADWGEGRWFPVWGPGRARAPTSPVAAGWPLGPQPGQLRPPAATWAPGAGERLLLRLPDLVVASPR